jgi:membrane protein YqaA with SNARE-associated domain
MLEILLLIIWSFFEAIFLPLPVDLIVVYLIKGKNYNPYLIAFIATIFNTLGSFFGYKIGKFLRIKFRKKFHEWIKLKYNIDIDKLVNKRIVSYLYFISTVSPLPQKVFAWISGYFEINVFLFLFYTVIGRGLRFFVIALLAEKLSWYILIILALVASVLYIILDRIFYNLVLKKLM